MDGWRFDSGAVPFFSRWWLPAIVVLLEVFALCDVSVWCLVAGLCWDVDSIDWWSQKLQRLCGRNWSPILLTLSLKVEFGFSRCVSRWNPVVNWLVGYSGDFHSEMMVVVHSPVERRLAVPTVVSRRLRQWCCDSTRVLWWADLSTWSGVRWLGLFFFGVRLGNCFSAW